MVEDPETLGFHHIHLNSIDPDATLKWYQTMFGGKPASLKGNERTAVWRRLAACLATAQGRPSAMKQRAIDHIAFVAANTTTRRATCAGSGWPSWRSPPCHKDGRTAAKRALLVRTGRGQDRARRDGVCWGKDRDGPGGRQRRRAPAVHDATNALGRARSAGHLHRQLGGRHPARTSKGSRGREDADVRRSDRAAGAQDAGEHLGLRPRVA